MDLSNEIRIPAKRRHHSRQFKARVLEEAMHTSASIAAAAQRHNLNANLIHKWRRASENPVAVATVPPAFLALPVAPAAEAAAHAQARIEIRITGGHRMLCDDGQKIYRY